MRRSSRFSSKPFFLLGAFIILLFSLSGKWVSKSRRFGMKVSQIAARPLARLSDKETIPVTDEIIGKASTILIEEERKRLLDLISFHPTAIFSPSPEGGRGVDQLMKSLENAIPGRVIYRSQQTWNQSFWIDLGEKENRLFQREVIGKDSPVIFGDALVGVIEEVEEKRARVRLITDPSIVVSVCVIGKEYNDHLISQKCKQLIHEVNITHSTDFDVEEKKQLLAHLSAMTKLLDKTHTFITGPRGEVFGACESQGRKVGNLLKGKGFLSVSKNVVGADIREGDLLITSGLDGVFPPGIRVGAVKEVLPSFDGASTYEITVLPLLSDMDHLKTVFILPPRT